MENLQEKYDALIKRYNALLDENEDGLARPLKKVAINRSVSTNGTEVPVTKNETSAQNARTETLLL